jgi:hypothetical protein
MRQKAAIAMGTLLLMGAACPKEAEMDSRPRPTTPLPRPRAPDAAVREELESARQVRTIAAYNLFIERHSDHPLAEIARRERARLKEPRR